LEQARTQTAQAVDDSESPAPVDPSEMPASEDAFQVVLDTSKGEIVIEVSPGWAPLGAEHFRKLVEARFYDECRFFRVVPGFVVQFGINGDPAVYAQWENQNIADDPVLVTNARGTVTFANAGPGTRSTQLFISLGDNGDSLDQQPSKFAPFGKVVKGMDVVDAINSQYGEEPDQGQIGDQGNAYLNKEFPELDFIRTARIVSAPPADGAAGPSPGQTP
jgi:cyclophilin family peptidyl-prolyl cis-trans isomerase